MDRQRLYGAVAMTVFALVALYGFYASITNLTRLVVDARRAVPVLIIVGGDFAVIPGAIVVLLFWVLEIVRPTERWRRPLLLFALGAFFIALIGPIMARFAADPLLAARGYRNCPERVIGYTLQATRYARNKRDCGWGIPSG